MAINRTALSVAAAAFLIAPCAWAFPPAATKLICDGKYHRFDKPLSEAPQRGIFIDISATKLRIDGSTGFDGSYVVTQTDERIVQFAKESDPAVRGFLNRLNGDLSLGHFRDAKNRTEGLAAECKIAKHMF